MWVAEDGDATVQELNLSTGVGSTRVEQVGSNNGRDQSSHGIKGSGDGNGLGTQLGGGVLTDDNIG